MDRVLWKCGKDGLWSKSATRQEPELSDPSLGFSRIDESSLSNGPSFGFSVVPPWTLHRFSLQTHMRLTPALRILTC